MRPKPPFIAIYLALGLSSLSFADVVATKSPYGTYRLELGVRANSSVPGKEIGSCGDEAQKELESHALLIVKYKRNDSDIMVNDDRWESLRVDETAFARKRDTAGFLLTLGFYRSKRGAEGRLMYMRVDSGDNPTCVDVYKLTGSYKR